MKNSQSQQILEHLKQGKSITPLEALDQFGRFRLGARIWDIIHGKVDGVPYNIASEMITLANGKRVGKYQLYAK